MNARDFNFVVPANACVGPTADQNKKPGRIDRAFDYLNLRA
jgi:hypothetical protein